MLDRPPDKRKPRPSATNTRDRAITDRHGLATRRHCNARQAALLTLIGAGLGLVWSVNLNRTSALSGPPPAGLEWAAALTAAPHRRRSSSPGANQPLDTVLAGLERVKQTGPSSWLASCPTSRHAHGDRSRGLSVREGDEGRVLIHCFAGCPVDEVVNALGLELSDLFPARAITYPHHADKGQYIGRARYRRIPWPDVWEALELDICACSIAFSDLSRGHQFTPEEAASIARLAGRLAGQIRELQHGR